MSMAAGKVSWLHITDWHIGQRNDWLWPNMRQQFFDDLTALAEDSEVGPWDFVIFSGDIVQGGKSKEFEIATEELKRLWEHFDSLGQRPQLLIVPGNHDLVRPKKDSRIAISSHHWHNTSGDDVRQSFWADKASAIRREVVKAFANYTDWLSNLDIPKPSSNLGILPGDFSTTIAIEHGGLKIGVVGLNTTFLQVTSMDYEAKLDIHIKQLNQVCSADPPKWAAEHDHTILITHQPPEWLDKAAQEQLEEIYQSGRFHSHFCGHLHKSKVTDASLNGAPTRRIRQAASLFGLSKYGINKRDRIFGFTAGQWNFSNTRCVERLWPRIAHRNELGSYRLSADRDFSFKGTKTFVEIPFEATPRVVIKTPLVTNQIPDQKSLTVQWKQPAKKEKGPMIEKFTEEVIYELFGNEAAEGENLQRLKEYYFKGRTYEQISSSVPLRILVGHKGIGKSALFKVAMAEDIDEKGFLAVVIKPDDVVGIQSEGGDFLGDIKNWKQGIIKIITEKVLDSLGVENTNSILSKVTWHTGQVIETLERCILDGVKRAKNGGHENSSAHRFLQTKTIVIYIDDLDRGWKGRPQDIERISALLNAVRDLSGENEGVRFRIALRSDVYFLYRTADESTDKIEGSVIWYSWTNHDILILLAKRIETYFGRELNDSKTSVLSQARIAEYLNPVMDSTFHGKGGWASIPTYRMLMTLIRKRPRDLVKICTLAARKANDMGRSKISSEHFTAVFEEYSQGRIQDTVNEYRSELKDIKRLILSMRPTMKERSGHQGFLFTTEQLLKKLKNSTQSGQFMFANKHYASAKELAAFLYKINFLTARKDMPSGEIDRKYFEENRYLSNEFVDFGYSWEIHPAYRWALQPESLEVILDNLDTKAG